ncbi:hypothetical protein ACQUQU_05505 [Thalassolituus sp. LLYu03]|uniref:hypothetical protein n=1 Tax=Thalassolituus sp. LLYu03 TaxID=3421656 RepID=UPI003D2AA058
MLLDNRRLSVLTVLLVLASGLAVFFPMLGMAKYLLAGHLVWFRAEIRQLVLPFLMLVGWGGVVYSGWEGIKDVVFILCYVAPFVFGRLIVTSKDLNYIFLALIAVFIVTSIPALMSGFHMSLLGSESTLESHTMAFVFGAFAVYYFGVRSYILFLIALVLVVLSLKRIALLGIFVAILFMMLPFVFGRFLKYVALVVNLLYVVVCFYITSEDFNDFCMDYMEVSSAYFTQGRSVLYSYVYDDVGLSFFGAGSGAVYGALWGTIADGKVLLHNDVLKIFMEYGVIVFCLFWYAFYSVKSRLALSIVVYLNVLFMTDNVLIYVFVMFFALLLMKVAEEEFPNEN